MKENRLIMWIIFAIAICIFGMVVNVNEGDVIFSNIFSFLLGCNLMSLIGVINNDN